MLGSIAGSGPASCQRIRPQRAKSCSCQSGGREPSGGGGVEVTVRGVASLHLSALWGHARATGRLQEAHAASELQHGCSPLPAPLNPTLHAAHPSATLSGRNARPGGGCCGNSTYLHQTCGCKNHVRDSATARTVAGLF